MATGCCVASLVTMIGTQGTVDIKKDVGGGRVASEKRIRYVAFYDVPENHIQQRVSSPAAANKIDYICSVLARNDYNVEIISPSWTNSTKGFYKGGENRLSPNISLKTFHTFGVKYRFSRWLKYFFSLVQLFIYLLIHVQRHETIIVYHSVILYLPIRFAKRLKGFDLLLEVEEIYQNVIKPSELHKRYEYAFFDLADKYIFCTGLLNEKINCSGKPHVVIHGVYETQLVEECGFGDNRIHVVYAGTFDTRKGGALIAASAAEFLDENYHVHIIGFGTTDQTNQLESLIASINKESRAMVSYDGFVEGKDYIKFLQKCHIGLSTQDPCGEYNNTSFPSKILSYLANGLRVVSVRIEVVENSAIADKLYYYEEHTPQDIADAITKIDFNKPYDSRQIVKELDEEFNDKLLKLLNS